MQCPFCGQDNDKVVDSRGTEGGRGVRRRRQCLACEKRFTTYEWPEETVRLTVVKKDSSREPYDRSKVISGLQRACYKRPGGDRIVQRVMEIVEEELFRQFDREAPSSFIGDVAGRGLRDLDKVAYIRFASVYRDFADVGELIDEAREVDQAPQVGPEQKELFDKPH